MRSLGPGASHGSPKIMVDPNYLSKAERVISSQLVKWGKRRVTREQVRRVAMEAETIAVHIEEIEMLDSTGLFRRLKADLARLQNELRKDRIALSLGKALGRQARGGPQDKLLSSWYVVPALFLYMRYCFGEPQWEWISNWISAHPGMAGHDAYDWWKKVAPKTRKDWDGLRPEKRLLTQGAAREFIRYTQIHYLDHHAPQKEIEALFKRRWEKLNGKVPRPLVTLVRGKSCDQRKHRDRMFPENLVHEKLPFLDENVLSNCRAESQDFFLAGKHSGCSTMTIRTKAEVARHRSLSKKTGRSHR